MRLEREAAGYHSVVFGGANPDFVERLWRRDRVRFWSVAPVAALALGAAAWWWRGWALALVAALLWAPTAAFAVAGLRSFAQQHGRGGVGWWSLAGVLSISSVVGALL